MFSFEGTSVVDPCQCYPSQVVHIRCHLYLLTPVSAGVSHQRHATQSCARNSEVGAVIYMPFIANLQAATMISTPGPLRMSRPSDR